MRFASEPVLAAAASMHAKCVSTYGCVSSCASRASAAMPPARGNDVTSTTSEESAAEMLRSSGISSVDGDGRFSGDSSDHISAELYARNALVLPLLHLFVGVLNNLQGVAWREYLLHGAASRRVSSPPTPHPHLHPHPHPRCRQARRASSPPSRLSSRVSCVRCHGTSRSSPPSSQTRCRCVCLRRLPYLLLGLALQGGGWLLLGILDTHATLSIIAAQQFVVTLGQVGSGLIS